MCMIGLQSMSRKTFLCVIMLGQGLWVCFCVGSVDAGHAAQVRLDNMADVVWEQHAVKVLTGLRCSMALNSYLCPCR